MISPLAMTEFGASILFAAVPICVALVVHALWPHRRGATVGVTPRRFTTALTAALEFSALWVWLLPGLTILIWLFWAGDNSHWFYDHGWLITAAIAGTAAAATARKLWIGTATRRFARIHLGVPCLLLTAFGTVWLYGFAQKIDVTDPDAVARNFAADRSSVTGEPVRAIEEIRTQSRCKHYWLMGADEPRGRLSVCPHGWFWWRVAGNSWFPPSEEELARADAAYDSDRKILILKTVIENYPGTPAAAEARQRLQSMDENQGRTPNL